MNAQSIKEMFDDAIETAAKGDRDYFAEVTVDGHWLQITWELVNIDYPLAEDPEELLVDLRRPQHVTINEWEPGKYLTWNHGGHDTHELAEFVFACVSLVWANGRATA